MPRLAAQAQPPQKVDKVSVVTVTGCLTQGPNDSWMLTNATEPVAARGRGAAAATTTDTRSAAGGAASVTTGKNRFKLIGILELNVPAHKGHTVTVRGLLINAQPEKRINLTSVQMVSENCAPAAGAQTKRP
jgi:hypothetical protein